MNDIIPEMISMTELVIIPADLYRIGKVSIAPPTIELNMASTVVKDEFVLETSAIIKLSIFY